MSSTATYPNWPLDKIKKNLQQYYHVNNNKNNTQTPTSTPTSFYVLLTTGAMNPCHVGHTSSMHHAARGIIKSSSGSANSSCVILGAFISPSGDKYLQGKFHSKPDDFYLPASIRYEACKKTTENDPLIGVGGYEVNLQNRWADFPEVCAHLQQTLDENAKELFDGNNTTTDAIPKIEVVYCCGSDHFISCGLERGVFVYGQPNRTKVAVTPRGREDFERLKKEYKVSPSTTMVTQNNFFLEPVEDEAISDISSTKIRKALKVLMGGVIDPEVVAICLSKMK